MNIFKQIVAFFTDEATHAPEVSAPAERVDYEHVEYVDRKNVEAMKAGDLMKVAHSRFGEHDAQVYIKCFGEFGYALAVESDHYGIDYYSLGGHNQTFSTVGYVRRECTTKDIDAILCRIGLAFQYAKTYCVRLKEAGERVKENDRLEKML